MCLYKEEVMKETYQTLQKLRLEENYTYQDMAEKLNISKCYYWQIEHKKRRLYYDLAKRIAAIFHLKPDDIFFDEIE
jgi:putative transcriptional regulator